MNLLTGITALALTLSSLNSKAAGVAWLGVVVFGMAVWLHQFRKPISNFSLNAGTDLPIQIAQWWIWISLAALVLMFIPTVHWSGPWPERHPQWRLLLGALGVWCLLRYLAPAWSALQVWSSAAAFSLLLAYGLVLMASSSQAPTNRIPWMAGLSLLSCALLTLSYGLNKASLRLRQFWLGASASLLVTLLLSGVRGSFPLLLIWPLTLGLMHRSDPALWRSSWRWLLPILALLFALGLPFIPIEDNPMVRIVTVFLETGAFSPEGTAQAETSSGIRLILYRTALHHVFDHPIWGIGPAAAKALIHQALMNAGISDSNVVESIGHFHSDLLNPWVEFGLLGLAGYLTYGVGMILIAWHLKRQLTRPTLALGMLATALVHLATGLSNMNLAHNYYPIMLAISVSLIFLCIRGQALSESR